MFRFDPPSTATYAAFALGMLMLAGLFVRFPIVALAFVVGSCYFWFQALMSARKDPYDLKELKEIHERMEWHENSEEPAHEGLEANVFCPHCSNVYAADLRACPMCGRSVNT